MAPDLGFLSLRTAQQEPDELFDTTLDTMTTAHKFPPVGLGRQAEEGAHHAGQLFARAEVGEEEGVAEFGHPGLDRGRPTDPDI